MDGAGRLARSLRSLRPQADLKAAAIGAAALLRGRPKIARAPAKPSLEREPPHRLIAWIEHHVPHRAGVAATVLLLLGSAGFGVVRGGHVEELSSAFSDSRNAIANSVGFRITSVAINGRKQLTQDEMLGIGGVNGRSSLLFLDAAAVRDRLKANPWIADATVLKLYPGRLQIDIVERSAFALWQQDGRLSVIADDGAVLEPYLSRRFLSLPLVVGKGAETHAKDFLALLSRYPQVHSVTKAAIFVGERRWNLRLKDGLDIRLPENDVGNALASLSNLDKEDHLFTRDIVAVDMRLPDRLTVQLSDDAAKAREELFKDKKPRRRSVTHDRPRSQSDAEDAPDAAEAHGAGGLPRYRHQQDRLHDRAAEAVPAERGAARTNPCRRIDRIQPDPVARGEGRRGGRSRRMRAGGAPGGGAGRAHGQGPGRVGACSRYRAAGCRVN